MKLALLQANMVIGDLRGNADLIVAGVLEAARSQPDLILTPELSLTGCPPQDILLGKGFVAESLSVLETLAADLEGAPPVMVGLAVPNRSGRGRPLFNAAALLQGGKVQETVAKTYLSSCGALEERPLL
jgi:NAD+ synthase (glutamine-hydrolysing)